MSRHTPKPNAAAPPTRASSVPVAARRLPLLRLGPGLVLALLAIWLLAPQLRGGERPGPQVRRSKLTQLPVPPAAPDPDWVLVRAADLHLRPEQTGKMRRLHDRWARETGPLRASLDRATSEFRSGMDAGAKRVTLPQLQERAAPVTELSRQLADARRAWWGEAGTVLTAAQRGDIEAAWAAHWQGERGSRVLR